MVVSAISLKYNISIQQLKKQNRLYTNDSFYLKETILIPCPDVIPTDMPLVSQDGAQTLTDEIQSIEKSKKNNRRSPKSASSQEASKSSEMLNGSATSHIANGRKDNVTKMQSQNRGSTPPSPNISDIFKRFDTQLEITKSNVEKLAQNSACVNYSSSNESLVQFVPRENGKREGKRSPAHTKSHKSSPCSRSSPSLFPESKRHDDLYQL